MPKCSHKEFRETKQGSSKYKCITCPVILDMNDSVDLLNGSHETIKGRYDQIVVLRKK